MKWGIRISFAIWLLVAIGLWLACKPPAAHAGVPEQAQASNLAVPGQEAQLPYAGAIVVVQCKSVVALVLIGHDGKQHFVDLRTSTPAMVTTQLSQAPADDVTQVEVSCPAPGGGTSV